MRAIDTNIVLRVILNDDPIQTPLAMRMLEEPVFVGLSVLMETEWVLRSSYRQPRSTIAAVLAAFVKIPTVSTPDDAGVDWAIARFRDHGADLDDMLHIVSARGTSAFASFEKSLANQAGAETPVAIERPA